VRKRQAPLDHPAAADRAGAGGGSAMNPVAGAGRLRRAVTRTRTPALLSRASLILLTECADARLHWAVIEWPGGEPRTDREAFNVANGDVIVWETFFKRLAAHFQMPLGEPTEIRIADEMPRHADLWRRIAQRDGLRVADLESAGRALVAYADATWASRRPFPVPPLVSTIKLRQYGFGGCIDTEECIVQHLEAMSSQGYLPKALTASALQNGKTRRSGSFLVVRITRP